jgi:hypothetical protein
MMQSIFSKRTKNKKTNENKSAQIATEGQRYILVRHERPALHGRKSMHSMDTVREGPPAAAAAAAASR